MTIVVARRKGDKYSSYQSGIDSMLANKEEHEAGDDFKLALRNLRNFDSPVVAQSVLEVAQRQEARKAARRMREEGLVKENAPASREEIVSKLSSLGRVKVLDN